MTLIVNISFAKIVEVHNFTSMNLKSRSGSPISYVTPAVLVKHDAKPGDPSLHICYKDATI